MIAFVCLLCLFWFPLVPIVPIVRIRRAFRVYYRKVNPPGASDYLMDHSSFIYLVGPDGRVRQLFRPNTPPETIAAAIRGQLRQL